MEIESRLIQAIDISEQRIADMSIDLMKVLLSDKTTGKYIIWATDNYKKYGDAYFPRHEIKPELVVGRNSNIIQPRVSKSQFEQLIRTREKAEVFTPSWICNMQNNLIDDAWFGRTGVFNFDEGTIWTVNTEKVIFPKGRKWQDYVDARRLEISCGEAPYLVSRYDTVTGVQIPIDSRIGLLDRKLRIVRENTENENEWLKWVTRAFQSTYGYEYQGDNVLLARENLLLTFIDYYVDKTGQNPNLRQIKVIANIISWNIWQMDGLSLTVPFSESPAVEQQINWDYELFGVTQTVLMEAVYCKIFDWRANMHTAFF